ncbi:tRNA (adenine(22)-N(1))-methyltransferase [Shewanella saliphila]|uniref:SAM-dependent methyltransferase n=1 Tax=Shewanella saliphila TaxID=2282698 RepID=A0ABQ2Q7F1_9GAMM|nr:tRNA (adenine(22)-N(1))-methyltransferase TrmK [Shewanella saliphila]MCL1102667.1 tRNA (adenine(22)-N(1))-methyltransferase TrmK [Shewanella saliphila]GGP59267.1 SAM-dependent methyltransferase [Shewanella saliphila]
MKLGQRLTQLNDMIPTGYTHIWDCCCDHGLLGAALLSRQAAPTIHFVDIVPNLMQQLERKLERFYPLQNPPQWQVHCMDVAQISLSDYPETPLVIIAGVGGDLMIELVNSICHNNSELKIDFMLCPVHHQHELRQKLIELDCRLIDETLLEENRRFYEILYVSRHSKASSRDNDPSTLISPVGNKLWQVNTQQQLDIAQRYLDKMLRHYQKISMSNPQKAAQALQDYRMVRF